MISAMYFCFIIVDGGSMCSESPENKKSYSRDNGNKIETISIKTLEDCQQKCRENPDCKFWSFYGFT